MLDPMGGIHTTSDGNAILREIDVTHPAAKHMIELSRTQDEEVGDGTTSVIILAGEMLAVAEPYIENNTHPTKIVKAFYTALDDAIQILEQKLTRKVDINDKEFMKQIIRSCIGTKFTKAHSDKMSDLALEATTKITRDIGGRLEVDIKRYARIEKIPGGSWEESRVLNGVMLEKDVLHPSMRRRIEKPRILLLDCGLEYKKGESMTNVSIQREDDFEKLLEMEDKYIRKICLDIIKFKPDLVVTEKGVSDLAIFYLAKHNISVLRRLRKTDNNRIARAVGATIVHKTEEIRESDIGKGCGLFEVRKIGDEYYSFIEDCKDPKACTILLRGPGKDLLSEIERNLVDAMNVVRNVILDPRVVPGGGATEMAISRALIEKSKTIKGVEQLPYQAVAVALEVIPRTLADNCGVKTIKILTELRAKHAKGENSTWGIDGTTGKLVDMNELGVWDSVQVKAQTIKTAIESACMLLRIDDVVSGITKKKQGVDHGGETMY